MPRQALRRALLLVAAAAALKPLQRRAALGGLTSAALAQTPLSARAEELSFSKTRNGLEWADAKVGSGSPFRTGQRVAVDYVMSTTGARYGSKIDATKDRNEPYSWVLGDGTTILGLAQCI
jgi:peptidylprolyl isomerase